MEKISYQPTAAEIKTAEDFMEDNEKELSFERELILKQVEQEIPDSLKEINEKINSLRSGKYIGHDFSIYDSAESNFDVGDTYLNDDLKHEKRGFNPLAQEGMDKLKQFVSGEAYGQIIDEFNKNNYSNDDKSVSAVIAYMGKSFERPEHANYEFSDCWLKVTKDIDFEDYDSGFVYYNCDILITKKMTPEERERHLDSLENKYNSEEYYEELRDS